MRKAWNKGLKMPQISGKNNYQWKENPGYFALHNWLKNYYGKASKCENLNCQHQNPKRFEWALLKDKDYERKRENFIQLCCSCHRKYDYTDEQRIKSKLANKGRMPPNTKYYKIDNQTYTLRQLSIKYNIKYATLWNRLNTGYSLIQALTSKKYVNQYDSPLDN